MNAEVLVVIVGILLSLLFRYVPGFAPWFERLDGAQKSAFQAGLTGAAALGIWLLSCYGPYDAVSCDDGGAWELAELVGKALVANQTTHVVTNPKRPYQAVG
jgi:hypothetical protein